MEKIVNLLLKVADKTAEVMAVLLYFAELAYHKITKAIIMVVKVILVIGQLVWDAFGKKVVNVLRNAAAIAIVVAMGYVGWLLYDGIQNPLYLEFSGYKGVSVSQVAKEYIGDQYGRFSSCVIYSRATEEIVKNLKTDNKFVCRGQWDDNDKTVIWEDEMIVPSQVTVENLFGEEVKVKCMLRDRK